MDLNNIMMLINSSHDIDEILRKVVEETCKALGSESARIAVREGENWVIRYVSNLPDDLIGRSFTDEELPHAALAMTTRKPVAIDDAFRDDRTNTGMMKSLGIKSVLVLPLLEKTAVTGTLLFGFHARAATFTEHEIDYAETMATGVSIALENTRLLAKAQLSESRLKEAEKLGKSGYFNYDIATRKTTWSKGLFHIFGRDPVLGEPTVEDFFALYAIEPGREVMRKLVKNNETSEFDAKIKRGDLTGFLHVVVRSLQDDKGDFVACFGTVQDITERKRAEETLRFSEERYRALFRDNPTMIVTLDSGLMMLSVNPACASQLGYTVDELEGQSVLKLFDEEDRPAVTEQLQKCLQFPAQVHRWQFCKVRKDGGLLWVEETAQAVYDLNGVLNLLVVCQDITERKRAEAERGQLLLQLEAVLENIVEGVVIFDLEGGMLTMNTAAMAIHDYESIEQVRQLRHQYRETFELSDLEGRPVAFEEWPVARALRGERFADYEVRVRRKDTGKSWVGSYSGTPVQTKSGNIILAVNTVRDISERKSTEEEIARLNVSLAARAADLEAFNYTVAHDLRNPMNTLSLSCQSIKMFCSDLLTEECKEFAQNIYNSTLHMNQLIDALLTFSRMGHVEPQREKVALSALAQEAVAMLQQTEPERQVDFRSADGIEANGDASLLRVVLDNLLGNAWKYTSMREKAVIEFGVREIDGVPTYFVRDNGAGFDKTDADKLFAPFQRLPDAEKCKGFGIGLATVERIISRHGGRVWAEGDLDKGATFYFTLATNGAST
jgi:PAS domain S-box-containing protein